MAKILNCDYVLYDASYGHAVYDEAPGDLNLLYEFFSSGT